jgi:hypothetical protein
MSCADPIRDEVLTRYWLDDLVGDEAQRVEEHIFGCSSCTERLTAWANLIDGLRDLTRAAPPPIVSRRELALIERRGTRVFEIHAATARIHAPVPDWADICVMCLDVELSDVERADLVLSKPGEDPFLVIPGIPLDPSSGEILVACSRHVASAHRELRFVVRGWVGDAARTLADCVLVNAP